ncbi:MAG: tRNA (guanosine(37)-N1)-methyltransferase TrmD [Candidatus Nanopelagicales bacterium]
MRIDIVSVFPEYLEPLRLSLVGKAIERGQIDLHVHDLRDFTSDKHRTVDDAPFGGGPGMVMLPEPWALCLESILESGKADGRSKPTLVIPVPSGRQFTQRQAEDLASLDWMIFACGRYEGIDSRVADYFAERCEVRELSIGDYVLAGGEAAVLVMVEAAARLVPGVLGNPESHNDDSFSESNEGFLEGPIYTRPEQWRGLAVPPILLSGDHAAVANWRKEQSRERTAKYRPDLLGGQE